MTRTDDEWLVPAAAARALGVNVRQLPTVALCNSVKVRAVGGSHLRYSASDILGLAARSTYRPRVEIEGGDRRTGVTS